MRWKQSSSSLLSEVKNHRLVASLGMVTFFISSRSTLGGKIGVKSSFAISGGLGATLIVRKAHLLLAMRIYGSDCIDRDTILDCVCKFLWRSNGNSDCSVRSIEFNGRECEELRLTTDVAELRARSILQSWTHKPESRMGTGCKPSASMSNQWPMRDMISNASLTQTGPDFDKRDPR